MIELLGESYAVMAIFTYLFLMAVGLFAVGYGIYNVIKCLTITHSLKGCFSCDCEPNSV